MGFPCIIIMCKYRTERKTDCSFKSSVSISRKRSRYEADLSLSEVSLISRLLEHMRYIWTQKHTEYNHLLKTGPSETSTDSPMHLTRDEHEQIQSSQTTRTVTMIINNFIKLRHNSWLGKVTMNRVQE